MIPVLEDLSHKSIRCSTVPVLSPESQALDFAASSQPSQHFRVGAPAPILQLHKLRLREGR